MTAADSEAGSEGWEREIQKAVAKGEVKPGRSWKESKKLMGKRDKPHAI